MKFLLKNYGRITLSSDISSSNLNMPLKKVKLLIYKNVLINKKNLNLYFKVPHPLTLSLTLMKDIPGDDPVLPPHTKLHIVKAHWEWPHNFLCQLEIVFKYLLSSPNVHGHLTFRVKSVNACMANVSGHVVLCP